MKDEDLESLANDASSGVSADELMRRVEAVERGESISTKTEIPKEAFEDVDMDSDNLYKILNELTISQKIKLALLGNKTARTLLIRDTNKQVPLFVLQNPRLGEDEVLEFAKNQNLDDQVLRLIARNATWMKNYAMKVAIVNNAKVPIDTSLKWLKHLRDRDLRNIARSKNVPQVLTAQSRKLLEKRKK